MTREKLLEQIRYSLAFNFPSVLFVFGPDKWETLRPFYMEMVEDNDPAIRRSLAHSLHELAIILGIEITERELYPLFKRFLQDTNREVRFGVLSHFDRFLSVVKPEDREDCLANFAKIQSNQSGYWRLRSVLGTQIKEYVDLFATDTMEYVKLKLVELAFKLSKDKVASVRGKVAS